MFGGLRTVIGRIQAASCWLSWSGEVEVRQTGPMSTKATDNYNFREPATFETEALSILAFEFAVSEHGECRREIV